MIHTEILLACISLLKKVLENVVVKGTANNIDSSSFSMAGKTGTCQKDYKEKDKLNYISSFVGFLIQFHVELSFGWFFILLISYDSLRCFPL